MKTAIGPATPAARRHVLAQPASPARAEPGEAGTMTYLGCDEAAAALSTARRLMVQGWGGADVEGAAVVAAERAGVGA
jgi:hypothetical protein